MRFQGRDRRLVFPNRRFRNCLQWSCHRLASNVREWKDTKTSILLKCLRYWIELLHQRISILHLQPMGTRHCCYVWSLEIAAKVLLTVLSVQVQMSTWIVADPSRVVKLQKWCGVLYGSVELVKIDISYVVMTHMAFVYSFVFWIFVYLMICLLYQLKICQLTQHFIL